MSRWLLELIVRLVSFAALVVPSGVSLSAANKPIDTKRSTITVHVGKGGLLSAAGHEHWISAAISSGVIDDSDDPHVEFTVEASMMEVQPDPKVDAKSQADIQTHMRQMTLESGKYPEITFRSTRVEKQSGGQWKVEGMLTLHGVMKAVVVGVKAADGAYVSRVMLKQTDFGIKPITVGGGLIKVKNEVELDFRIFARSE